MKKLICILLVIALAAGSIPLSVIATEIQNQFVTDDLVLIDDGPSGEEEETEKSELPSEEEKVEKEPEEEDIIDENELTGDEEKDIEEDELTGDEEEDVEEDELADKNLEEDKSKMEEIRMLDVFEGNVRLQATGEFFDTLHAALTEAYANGTESVILEVVGSVTETVGPVINANMNVTIVGAEGEHTVTLLNNTSTIMVQNGGSLTLGGGTNENTLTIISPVSAVQATDGRLDIKDGVIIKGDNLSSGTVHFNGTNVHGSISGGLIEGNRAAVGVVGGARISEISAGTFIGTEAALYMASSSGNTSRIDLISGGSFIQNDPVVKYDGIALYVQNNSQVGEISGGYFEAARTSAIVLARGGWIDTISGGEFVMAHTLSGASGTARTSAIYILNGYESEGYNNTGIGTISGGLFHGGYFGLLSMMEGSQINTITGGTFLGKIALQNDRGNGIGSIIDEISGGIFIGEQGILNVGIIKNITGSADIRGTSSCGIFNYPGGIINEISGGTIISEADYGIANSAAIKLISGGIFIGEQSAIRGFLEGTLEIISNGVFWGKNDVAIHLISPLLLEPGLSSDAGLGRYWGQDGVIFNDDGFVIFPDGYFMSTATEKAGEIEGVKFKYLRLSAAPEYEVTVNGSYADNTGAGVYAEGETVAINAGKRDGFVFAGWVASDGLVLADAERAITAFTMPSHDAAVTATWSHIKADAKLYKVAVLNSYAHNTGAGTYLENEIVTINAGKRDGFVFSGWTILDEIDCADTYSTTTVFTMPAYNVTVRADWIFSGGGTNNSHNDDNRSVSFSSAAAAKLSESSVSPFISEHISYILGFPDGGVKPWQNITRAEIAMVLFRLIDGEAKYLSQLEFFSDIKTTDWYAQAVNYLAGKSILTGYPDGSFRPNTPITRAELTAVMSKFFEIDDVRTNSFTDVENSHWAFRYINNGHNKGWITGYEDGSFCPDNATGRAEAVTMLNRVLNRTPNPEMIEHNINECKRFNDIDSTHWAYYQIMEAANEHEFYIDAQGREEWICIYTPHQ